MDAGLFAQYVMNGLMLGMMYALVAVGFTLFFGVLDIIKFSHGDMLTVGAFTALATYIGLGAAGIGSSPVILLVMLVVAIFAMAALGMLIARVLVLPLRSAPALNTLLITLMLGTALRESVRLFYPQGANPKPFPALLPRSSIDLGSFNLRLDNVLMLAAGVGVIVGLQYLLNRTKLGLAIRAVAQDEETARTMGINFTAIVLITFAIGSGLAAFAGIMNGLYYNEINFGMGLYLGVIGFAAAIIGGLGSIYGAILGGFLFAALQTIGTVALPFASAYKDVFAFAVVIIFMAWRPTGLIQEKISERVRTHGRSWATRQRIFAAGRRRLVLRHRGLYVGGAQRTDRRSPSARSADRRADRRAHRIAAAAAGLAHPRPLRRAGHDCVRPPAENLSRGQ